MKKLKLSAFALLIFLLIAKTPSILSAANTNFKSMPEAISLLEKDDELFEKNLSNIYFDLGKKCLEDKDAKNALKFLEKAASTKGADEPKILLADLYRGLIGDLITPDKEKALYWANLAKEEGSPNADAAIARIEQRMYRVDFYKITCAPEKVDEILELKNFSQSERAGASLTTLAYHTAKVSVGQSMLALPNENPEAFQTIGITLEAKVLDKEKLIDLHFNISEIIDSENVAKQSEAQAIKSENISFTNMPFEFDKITRVGDLNFVSQKIKTENGETKTQVVAEFYLVKIIKEKPLKKP